MSQPIVPANASATFVVRFWRETTAGEVRWRGQIEHVQSRESATFLELEGMLDFLRSFGVRMELHIRRTPDEI